MGLLDLLIDTTCVGCGKSCARICAACTHQLREANRPQLARQAPVPVWSGARYDGVVRSVVLAAKQSGRREYLELLAALTADAISLALTGLDLEGSGGSVGIIAIGSGHRTRQTAGLDVAGAVCRRSLRLLADFPVGLVELRALHTRSGGASQKTLARRDRVTNVRGRFRVSDLGDWVGRPLLIVDDVVTTSATILAASTALDRAGGQVIGAVVAADRQHRIGGAVGAGG